MFSGVVGSRRGKNRHFLTNELILWGLSARALTGATGATGGTAKLGRVVRVDRGECDVATEHGIARVLSDSTRAQGEVAPVTGDWVEIENHQGFGPIITTILERTTIITRRDTRRDIRQVLATNVDLVGVVHGLDRPLRAGHLERLLVLAINSGATPLVILTKADLATASKEDEATVRSVCGDIPVVVTSIFDQASLDELVSYIGLGRTLGLIGASGVGKSALVNALVGEDRLEIGAVRHADSKGRHTTTARELIMLPNNAGLVLDTPGIRSVGLWEAEQALHLVFGDLEELAVECRFHDCTHQSEPGCALVTGVAGGSVDAERVNRYVDLVAELDTQRQEEQRQRRSPRTHR